MYAVIYDVDGTLANVSGIRHYINGEARNFDKFHKAASYVRPNQYVLDAMQFDKECGFTTFVVTGRNEKYRYTTSVWLQKWNAPFDYLLMRPDGDFRKDVEIKREILMSIRQRGYSVLHAWDDNPNIIKLWREEGIPVTVVPGWEEE